MSSKVTPLKYKDSHALIEHVFPVQKLSAEAYKEQEGKQGKTLTTLGSYWKGRKPLMLNRACVLGCLLPVTENLAKDLEVFEMILGMDEESMAIRLNVTKQKLPNVPYRELVNQAKRPEEVSSTVNDHIWENVNSHLGTDAHSITELVEQLGIMRFGHRPIFGDAFSGSGQIPFEAARVGCDVIASDLNPIARMLTWGAFNIVGADKKFREKLWKAQEELVASVTSDLDKLQVETDGNGWKPKTFLYCVEVTCPQTGWNVPLLPTRLISKGKSAIAVLVPDKSKKYFHVEVKCGVSKKELEEAEKGTLLSDGRGQEPYLSYILDGKTYKTKISTLRGDYKKEDGTNANKLRFWEKSDFKHRDDDIYRDRLYAVQWMRQKSGGKTFENEFRSVTKEDLQREKIVEDFLRKHINEWQEVGLIPDMKIESGYNTDQPIREKAWTHWHHLFNPRQLLFLGLTNKHIRSQKKEFQSPLLIYLARLSDWSSKLCRYGTGAARESVAQTFYNQALNTLVSYGVRSFSFAKTYLLEEIAEHPLTTKSTILGNPANQWSNSCDIFITDPPYGDAVKYEEILEFFIAWLRKNSSPEFSAWTWDSRRALAVKGEDEEFRKGMVSAYTKMTECMPDNGLQMIMFTHQSGSIWADMANIVWASGLQVTAAWYVVTETDSALRDGSYVKGTVLLVLRKRAKNLKTTRDDLAWEIQEEVENQVKDLTGLNQTVKAKNRDENVFEDADLQMAGYAAALRVLTKYSVIDGREMMTEAIRPRVKGEGTFVDSLIEFAVSTANQTLVPTGIAKNHWEKLLPAERFILKMTDLEIRGAKTLDNYQNFAKAFKVRDFTRFMQSSKANDARLKSALEFGKVELGEGSELHFSTLRAIYFAMMEIIKEVDTNEILQHLSFNVKDYYSSGQQRELALAIAQYLGSKLDSLRPEEASAARVLSELIRNQRLG